MAALTVEFPQVVWTVEFGGDEVVVAEVTMTGGTGGGGTFDGEHNDLDGRSTADAHPISAITGLQAALDAAGGGGGDFQTVGPFDLLEGGGTLTGVPRHVAVSGSEGDLPGPVSVTMPSAPADPDGAWTVSYGAFDDASLDELDVVGALNLSVIPRGYTAVLTPVPGVGWFCDGLFPTATVPTGGGAVDSVNGQTGTVSLDLDDLTDVDTTTDPPDADDVLAWDGVTWTPATLTALGAPGLSNATPADLGTAAPGVSTEASRADHVHDLPTAADVGAVASSRSIIAGSGLSGGGDLTVDRTISADFGSGAGKVTEGNDARLSDARTPTAHAASHGNGGADEVSLDASQITTGTVAQARLGTGSAGAGSKFLADDQTYKTVSATETLPASIIDAKGDLIVGTAADTAARLPVGVNGCVLTADSSVSGGVKWAAPSTPAYIGGAYHLLTGLPSDLPGSAAMVPGANTLVAQLVHIHEPIAVSGRWIYVQTAAPSAVFRPAIYAASTSTGMPTGEPLVTSPAVDASSTGYKLDTFTASAVIPAGFYWEITASSSNTAGFRGGHNLTGQPQVDMGHSSGGAYSVRSFIASWAYSGAAMPDVSAFSWTARTAITELPPYLRWRIER